MLQRRRRDGPTACQTCATVLLASGAVAQVRLAKPMPVSPRLICPRRVRKALRTPSRASAISAVDLCDSPVEKHRYGGGVVAVPFDGGRDRPSAWIGATM